LWLRSHLLQAAEHLGVLSVELRSRLEPLEIGGKEDV